MAFNRETRNAFKGLLKGMTKSARWRNDSTKT